MDVQPTNLQQLCDAIMSIWTKISEECFQHLVESMPRRIKAVLKAKVVQPGTSKVYLIKWPVSVYPSFSFTVLCRIELKVITSLFCLHTELQIIIFLDFICILNSHITSHQQTEPKPQTENKKYKGHDNDKTSLTWHFNDPKPTAKTMANVVNLIANFGNEFSSKLPNLLHLHLLLDKFSVTFIYFQWWGKLFLKRNALQYFHYSLKKVTNCIT